MGLTVIGLSFLMVAMVTAEQRYMAIFPKELRNGMNFDVDFTLTEPASSLASVYFSICKSMKNTSDLVWDDSLFTLIIDPGQTSQKGSVMVPYDIPTGEEYFVHLSSTDLSIKPVYEKVIVTRPTAPILIVTDKPVYNPGQEVLYRVLVVDMYLKPETDKEVTVEIKDGNKNSIMKVVSSKTAGGGEYSGALVDGNFTLSEDPILGVYAITAMTSESYTEANFEVKEYVLPKFQVKLELDQSYVIDGEDATVSGKVIARYSYGKNVKGKAVVKVSTGYGESTTEWKNDNFEGSALFTVKVNTADMARPYPWMYDSFARSASIEISAEMTEENTDKTEFANAVVTIYPKAFAATIKKPLPLLFQGVTDYTFQVELTNPMGGMLKHWDENREDSTDLSYYTLYYKAANHKEFSTAKVTTNPQTITLNINTSDTSLYENAIEVYYEYTGIDGKIMSQRVREEIAKYYTFSMETLKVQLVPSENQNERCFKVIPFEQGDKAYYQLVNNYYPEDPQAYTLIGGHCFALEQKHAPKTRIVVYKIVDYMYKDQPGTELLTAYADVDVTWTPEQTVSLSVTSEQGEEVLEPGQNARVVIQTKGQAIVGVKGVDKSVGFMADANDITQMKLRELVEAFRLYDRKKENKFKNPPMFPMPIFREGPFRKKRCSACVSSDQYMDPRKLLEEAGLKILTDLSLKRQDGFDSDRIDYDYKVYMDAGPPLQKGEQEDVADSEADTDLDEEKEEEPVREDFPETWLWDIVMTGTNGVAEITKEVPDTITSWEVNAFAMNTEYGLSVSETKEITVFQPFFISMNLPYSVVRTENVEIDILVFNYKDTSLTVDVELEATENYTILDRRAIPRRVTIGPSSSGLTTWLVMFNTIGDIPLKAVAREVGMPSNVDRVNQPLIVEPEGREIREDDNVKVPGNGQMEKYFNMSKFFKTKGYVPGSLRMYLFVTGDMMGVFISNIVTKIKMPFGCGEQNIKSLTPSVFIARYLKQLGRLDQKTEALVGKVCGAGYRKEMNYLHMDGSYSAFGDRPNMCVCGSSGRKWGSTWLTAYVLKVFSLMYMDGTTYVSPEILKKSFDYINNNVTYKDCSYQYVVEKGELIHKEMQSGTASRLGLVAFVLVSVMDYKDAALKAGMTESVQEATDFISGASAWLKGQKTELLESRDLYQMALVAYALARASPDSADSTSVELLTKLETELNGSEPNMEDMVPPTKERCMYEPGSGERKDCTKDPNICNEYEQCCDVPCESKKMCSQKPYQILFRYHMPDTGSSMIETKGYLLMAYLESYSKEQNAVKKAEYQTKADNMKDWLLSQRKGNGFFSSTQDTVVALEALSRYAITFPNTNGGNFKVRAKADGKYVTDEVAVNSVTYTVTTERKLNVDKPPNNVSVEVSGISGTAFVNLVALYNVEANVSTPPYDIIIEPRKEKDLTYIKYCFRKNQEFTGDVGTMVVSSLKMQTGYTYSKYEAENPRDPSLAADKLETTPEGDITLYYMKPEDGFVKMRCNNFYFEEKFTVANRQPAVATVMDYYQQENNVEVLYSVETTRTVTTGASSARMNMILLIGAMIAGLLVTLLNIK